jgi:glycosyltransferase involved in cell wall biosynthesis
MDSRLSSPPQSTPHTGNGAAPETATSIMPAPVSEIASETVLETVPEISIVVPVYNEEENLLPLHDKLAEALGALGLTYEILYVDDGSSDRSFALLESIAQKDRNVRVIRFRRNFGQTAAMAAGLDYATGNVIIPLDADLQNDPADIPHLLAKMDEGFDVVSGWRLKRKDNALRRLPSQVANGLISHVTGVRLHDYGCSLKAYRASIIKDVELYGEMHRFIPAYAAMVGGRVTEIPVRHHPRVAGKSKYGIGRVFHDLLVVKYLGRYGSKPIYFFGGAGMWAFGLGTLLWLVALVQKFAQPLNLNRNPLFYVGILLFLMAMQFIMLGLLAEVNMRTYHESQKKPPYIIDQTCNL